MANPIQSAIIVAPSPRPPKTSQVAFRRIQSKTKAIRSLVPSLPAPARAVAVAATARPISASAVWVPAAPRRSRKLPPSVVGVMVAMAWTVPDPVISGVGVAGVIVSVPVRVRVGETYFVRVGVRVRGGVRVGVRGGESLGRCVRLGGCLCLRGRLSWRFLHREGAVGCIRRYFYHTSVWDDHIGECQLMEPRMCRSEIHGGEDGDWAIADRPQLWSYTVEEDRARAAGGVRRSGCLPRGRWRIPDEQDAQSYSERGPKLHRGFPLHVQGHGCDPPSRLKDDPPVILL